MKSYLSTLLLFISAIFIFNAQAQSSCGTHISAQDMQDFYNRDKSHLEDLSKGAKAIVNIPITYHLVADDNGLGAFTVSELLVLHCSLVSDFAPADVNFYINDIVTHNSDYYYNMEDDQAGNTMFNQENVQNTCNVFIVEEAKSGTTPVCGYSYLASYGYFLNGNGIVLAKSCVIPGASTFTHEMGHYLNLPHTFSGWEGRDYNLSPIPSNEWERVDGSNCNNTGDGFCDTPPDYLSVRWACSGPQSFDDAAGQSFIVDEKNYMSYSSDGCAEYFKPEQQAEVNAAPASYRSYLLNNTVPNLDPVATTQLFYPNDFDNNLSANNITFTWEEMLYAEYYLVEFTQSTFDVLDRLEIVMTNELTLTDLDLDETYKWRVKAFSFGNACASYTDFKTFSTAKFIIDFDEEDVLCAGENNGSVSVNSSVPASGYQLSEFDQASQSYTIVNSTSSNVFNNLSPNKYEVTVIANSGHLAIAYFDISDVDVINLNLSISGNNIFSNITGGKPPYSFTWSNGSSSSTNSNPAVGQNTLYVTDANSCFVSKSITYTPDLIPISDLDGLNSSFKMYPNPLIGDNLNIAFNAQQKDELKLELYSLDGKLILSNHQNLIEGENVVTINMASISKGVYVLKTTIGVNTITKKVIR